MVCGGRESQDDDDDDARGWQRILAMAAMVFSRVLFVAQRRISLSLSLHVLSR